MMIWMSFLLGFAGALAAVFCAFVLGVLFAKPLIQWVVARFTKRLMNDNYAENIWEVVTALTRTSPRIVVENSLRAAFGTVIERPFGSPRKFLNFNGLMFSPAQLATFPVPEHTPVDMSITIGPKARRPLKLEIPLMASAMGYGIGVTEKVKIAIAKATAAVGTSTNSGEGPFLQSERDHAKYFILQYHPGHWSKEPEFFRQADAIEIHIGQGATASAPSIIPPEFLQGKARELMGLEDDEILVIPPRYQDLEKPEDLVTMVEKLRELSFGAPIGVKICPTAKLEADLDVAIQAGVDFISIDGAQAGTKGGAPILEDDFGLPTIYALSRAVHHLRKRGVKEDITLLVGGGFATPGDCLKAIALGADGVYMGTALLWAMTHHQVTKTMPWEPPTQLTWYKGSMTEKFDEEEAAYYLENFFHSCVEEMKMAIRSMGKTSIREVNEDDLVALDEITGAVTQVRMAYEPYPRGIEEPTHLKPSATGRGVAGKRRRTEKTEEQPDLLS